MSSGRYRTLLTPLLLVCGACDGSDPVEPPVPAAVFAVGGDAQLGLPGAPLADPLVVSVVDASGNGISGLTVGWTVSSGAGSVANVATMTDASGRTSNVLTLGGSPGLSIVSALVGGLPPTRIAALAVDSIWDEGGGDTFPTGSESPDLLSFGAAWLGDTLLLGLSFADSVSPAGQPGPGQLSGFVDFDTDLDSLTGTTSAVDDFRPGVGSTGMGVDVFVDLFGTPDGDFVVFDFQDNILAVITPAFQGKLVSFTLDTTLVGVGPLAAAVVVGTPSAPTDIAPEDGAFTLGSSGGGAPAPGLARPEADVRRGLGKRLWRPVQPRGGSH